MRALLFAILVVRILSLTTGKLLLTLPLLRRMYRLYRLHRLYIQTVVCRQITLLLYACMYSLMYSPAVFSSSCSYYAADKSTLVAPPRAYINLHVPIIGPWYTVMSRRRIAPTSR
ncbi:hypothetical protein GGR50DRAFT_669568 [Xylaria sp. CBS 124048]|nr:hypothetical protein GGR50DRAFT_669568 [Xylaria sp. CBS 124048]